MNNYLIPANSKKGTLLFNLFRPIDLIIFSSGVIVTFILLISFSTNNSTVMLLVLLPGLLGAGLIMPVPNQHNVLVLLQAILKYFTSQQKYKWKGWSMYENFK